MIANLWKLSFLRMCVAYLLLFASLYMLLPAVPLVMANRFDLPTDKTGVVFLCFVLGMFAIGPLHSYLVDAYKRKHICLYAFGAMVVATAGYMFVHSYTELLLLCFVQGISFGIATTASITLSIDITDSPFRSVGNVTLSWAARFGTIAGIALGVYLYYLHSFETLVYISTAIGAIGVLCIAGVYVPFRAPIGARLCSFDRFLLPRGWIPAINMILVAFIPGALLLVFPQPLKEVAIGGILIPFFAMAAVGFLLSALLARCFFHGEKRMIPQVLAGLVAVVLSLSLLAYPSENTVLFTAILLGVGLGLATPALLLMLVKLSRHCQRATANTTHLLSWEAGIAWGVATACYLDVHAGQELIVQAALLVAVASLVFFVAVTFPYFKKHKVR